MQVFFTFQRFERLGASNNNGQLVCVIEVIIGGTLSSNKIVVVMSPVALEDGSFDSECIHDQRWGPQWNNHHLFQKMIGWAYLSPNKYSPNKKPQQSTKNKIQKHYELTPQVPKLIINNLSFMNGKLKKYIHKSNTSVSSMSVKRWYQCWQKIKLEDILFLRGQRQIFCIVRHAM